MKQANKQESKMIWNVENRIGHLIMNDPPSNKMDIQFYQNLNDIIQNNICPDSIDSILIYGKGRHFSSGADLENLTSTILDNIQANDEGEILAYPDFLNTFINIFNFFSNMEIPVISLLKGVCIGSGLEFALAAHFRIASETALLGFPEVTFNLMPGCSGTQKLPRLIGQSKALEMILTGNNIKAQKALELGLVEKIVPKKSLLDTGIMVAEYLASEFSISDIDLYRNTIKQL